MSSIKAVFGGGSIPHGTYADAKVQAEALDILLKSGVKNLDTARLYPGSEAAIGKLDARTSFTIDTKLEGGFNPQNGSGKEQVPLKRFHTVTFGN